MTDRKPQFDEAKAYGATFYDALFAGALRSARLYAALLWEAYQPSSVVDFGCGRGAWLKAFGEQGSARLVGYDGSWNSQADMVDQGIEFHDVDLNRIVQDGFGSEPFDLAMTLEVAEHLEPENSPRIVEALCAAAPVVMFGAAFLNQSGIRHINLHRHSFWAGLFASRDYDVFDYFRPALWGNSEVDYWHQQNTFLFVHRGHALADKLASLGYTPVKRLELLDCVHPDLLDYHANAPFTLALRKELKRRLPGRLLSLLKKVRESASPSYRA